MTLNVGVIQIPIYDSYEKIVIGKIVYSLQEKGYGDWLWVSDVAQWLEWRTNNKGLVIMTGSATICVQNYGFDCAALTPQFSFGQFL